MVAGIGAHNNTKHGVGGGSLLGYYFYPLSIFKNKLDKKQLLFCTSDVGLFMAQKYHQRAYPLQ